MNHPPETSPRRTLRRLALIIAAVAFPALYCGVTAAAQREFNMTIEEVQVQVAPGLKYSVFAFDGQVPGPLIHVRQGDDVTVHVTNNTSLPHTIHWHGVYQTNNWRNDGVPGITQQPIQPGTTFTYHWKAEKTGTLWYHCHVNVNEHLALRGMWGPIVVDPAQPTALEKTVTKDVIMMFSSWESPYADTYGKGGGPKEMPDYYSINGKSFPLDQPIRVKKGDVVRVRFIGAGGEFHEMHLHGHDMLVAFKDGLPLPQPYPVDTLLLGPGERYDVIVKANNPGRWIFHDHVDSHMTNGGVGMGGPMTVLEYDGIPADDWYVWKGKKYEPNFYYSESMKKGYGKFDNADFRGTAASGGHHHHHHGRAQ